MENFLIHKLRAWFWHCEVARLTLTHVYQEEVMPLDIMLKVDLYTLATKLIRFFVRDDALLLDDTE